MEYCEKHFVAYDLSCADCAAGPLPKSTEFFYLDQPVRDVECYALKQGAGVLFSLDVELVATAPGDLYFVHILDRGTVQYVFTVAHYPGKASKRSFRSTGIVFSQQLLIVLRSSRWQSRGNHLSILGAKWS